MNRTRLRWPLASALIALIAGCGEATAPAGTPSTVSVHAYVDADGTGTRTDGDPPIAGVTVELVPVNGGGAALQATTNAQGTAVFSGVEPGSYRARFTGQPPAGAVLATASEPIVVAPFRGGEVQAQFRFALNPGEIVGRLFRDNNGNGVFDAGDTPAPGIPVQLFRGAEATGEPVATTTTNAQGEFRFPLLRAGQYTYRFSPLPTMTITGGSTVTVTVEPAAPLQVAARFTGNLISTIAEVRALSGPTSPNFGETVAFEGVVTAGTGIFSTSTTGNQFNVQDATGGILILDTPHTAAAPGPQTGDSVRVVGRLQISAGELLIRQPQITVLATNRPLPQPQVVTAAQVAASNAADPLQGRLVSVANVRVDSVGAGTGGYNVFVSSGGSAFIVRVASQAIAPQSFWTVGGSYNITGTLASFNGAQIKIRSQADVTTGSLLPSIRDVRAGGAGRTVTIEGIATVGTGVFSTNQTSNQFNVQDATGGVLVLQIPIAAGIQAGDSVRVTGTTAVSGGEFVITTSPTVTILARNRPVPAPVTVTAQRVAQHTATDTLQGRLVRVNSVRVDTIGAGSAGYDVIVRDSAGNRFIVRVSTQAIAPQSFWQVGQFYDIVGTLAMFNNNPQVKIRSAADVAPAGTLPLAIGQARTVTPGTQVTVTGVLTAGVGVFSTNTTSNQMNVQDPTGGILVLQLPLAAGYATGDSVRVTGTLQLSAGELVITGNPTVTVISSNRPVPAPIDVTAQRVASHTASDPLQGSLVRVQNVTVTSVGSGSGGYNVTAVGPDGATFIIRVSLQSIVPQSFWTVGNTYTVTGTMSQFNGAQLKVRTAADIVAGS